MCEPFIGEVKLFAYDRTPRGWLPCDGQVLQIKQYQALYSLVGITYGGDGRNSFALPDLRGRAPVAATSTNKSDPYCLGEAGGADVVTLTADNLPAHAHYLCVNPDMGNQTAIAGNLYAQVAPASQGAQPPSLYAPMSTPAVAVDPSVIQTTGGGGAHSNMQPYLTLQYCIAIEGIYPIRP